MQQSRLDLAVIGDGERESTRVVPKSHVAASLPHDLVANTLEGANGLTAGHAGQTCHGLTRRPQPCR